MLNLVFHWLIYSWTTKNYNFLLFARLGFVYIKGNKTKNFQPSCVQVYFEWEGIHQNEGENKYLWSLKLR
jgi:hypothetical protein